MQPTPDAAREWIDTVRASAARGIGPATSNQTLAEYGNAHMQLARRGLEPKTTGPYLAGWRLRVIPALGHLPVTMVTNGAVDRTVYAWIADGEGRSTVKNSLAILVRVMEQALRDGLITVNPARVKGWQRQYQLAEDELDNPRALALRDWNALEQLAAALVARSHEQYTGWGDVVTFAACTAARIGEVSGARVRDIDRRNWIWTVRRQTTPSPGGLADKNTKGKVARRVPLIEEIRPMIARRLLMVGDNPDARLFTGPRGGRITTAVLRDATHWDELVRALGYKHLRRHDLRHTGLTWLADAGVPCTSCGRSPDTAPCRPPSATSTPTCRASSVPDGTSAPTSPGSVHLPRHRRPCPQPSGGCRKCTIHISGAVILVPSKTTADLRLFLSNRPHVVPRY
ncbi:tyrosine-type recombinase/integrase [Streptomyces sp. NBC_01476]|uniref:site-specific integrase n=1 Tax=Streptomyces sp. NBC_01476 TaxID=2903881 RepID=UPI002E344BA7|nr:tyrosine-type recombinase/integrase [Streptomyces sp. NBC_01476]